MGLCGIGSYDCVVDDVFVFVDCVFLVFDGLIVDWLLYCFLVFGFFVLLIGVVVLGNVCVVIDDLVELVGGKKGFGFIWILVECLVI